MIKIIEIVNLLNINSFEKTIFLVIKIKHI